MFCRIRSMRRSTLAAGAAVAMSLVLGACVMPGTNTTGVTRGGLTLSAHVTSSTNAQCEMANNASAFQITCTSPDSSSQVSGTGTAGTLDGVTIDVGGVQGSSCVVSGSESSNTEATQFQSTVDVRGTGSAFFDLPQGGNVTYSVNCANGQTGTGTI